MQVSEEDIAQVLKLVPSHSTMESLRNAKELQHLSIPRIKEALQILVQRGQVKPEELFGRS